MKFSRPDKFRVRRLPRAQRLNFLGRRCCWLTGWWVFSSIQPNRYSGRTTTTTPKHQQRAGEWVVRLWERNGWLDGEKDEMVMGLLVGWPPCVVWLLSRDEHHHPQKQQQILCIRRKWSEWIGNHWMDEWILIPWRVARSSSSR